MTQKLPVKIFIFIVTLLKEVNIKKLGLTQSTLTNSKSTMEI